jgi:hypothetical protein
MKGTTMKKYLIILLPLLVSFHCLGLGSRHTSSFSRAIENSNYKEVRVLLNKSHHLSRLDKQRLHGQAEKVLINRQQQIACAKEVKDMSNSKNYDLALGVAAGVTGVGATGLAAGLTLTQFSPIAGLIFAPVLTVVALPVTLIGSLSLGGLLCSRRLKNHTTIDLNRAEQLYNQALIIEQNLRS